MRKDSDATYTPATNSARRRARDARSSASACAHGASKSCTMRGMLAVAVEPSAATSCGTSRHPAGSRPSDRQASSTMFFNQGSRRKHIAMPAPGSPVSAGASGSSTPAPSPVTPSAAHAPRWDTAPSPARQRSSSSRDARPRTSATRPMPQASRSSAGSYRRCRSSEGCRVVLFKPPSLSRASIDAPAGWFSQLVGGAGGEGRPTSRYAAAQ